MTGASTDGSLHPRPPVPGPTLSLSGILLGGSRYRLAWKMRVLVQEVSGPTHGSATGAGRDPPEGLHAPGTEHQQPAGLAGAFEQIGDHGETNPETGSASRPHSSARTVTPAAADDSLSLIFGRTPMKAAETTRLEVEPRTGRVGRRRRRISARNFPGRRIEGSS